MSLDVPQGLVQLICTPIGNLADFTYRAVDCLKQADLVACEDTRHSLRLLSHYEIPHKELIALHEHNEVKRVGSLVERISTEQLTLAVLSDAGSPSISDPGYRLVQACIEAQVKVEVIPGPTAVITGLVGSGLPSDKFSFGGFLPVKSGKKESTLREGLEREGTSIYFESPHRILKTIRTINELDPDRNICVARELTKKFETYHRGTAAEVLAEFGESTVKGEITLLIEGLSRARKKQDRASKFNKADS